MSIDLQYAGAFAGWHKTCQRYCGLLYSRQYEAMPISAQYWVRRPYPAIGSRISPQSHSVRVSRLSLSVNAAYERPELISDLYTLRIKVVFATALVDDICQTFCPSIAERPVSGDTLLILLDRYIIRTSSCSVNVSRGDCGRGSFRPGFSLFRDTLEAVSRATEATVRLLADTAACPLLGRLSSFRDLAWTVSGGAVEAEIPKHGNEAAGPVVGGRSMVDGRRSTVFGGWDWGVAQRT